ncbi:hypothetical protein TRVA0_024S01948 [Trichomonascus vanleenenianus]|uniref:uncharacterized protein n=1 Tax=Trichomonascus vanleenenianus TaxID=2268995 RepID=UPI003EC983F2
MRMVTQDTEIGAGDCKLVRGFISDAEDMLETLEKEVEWQEMRHRGGAVPRLVAVQAAFGQDGSYPVYRHPADELPETRPFSTTVQRVREQVERVAGHPVNHVLIQLYRGGEDYISEHADKTLDIAQGSYIVNVSFGAERYMVLRRKDKENRDAHKLALEHNSALLFGLETNRQWLHGIRQNRQLHGSRISLTFRLIETFVRPRTATYDTATTPRTATRGSTATGNDGLVIWGKGATQGEASLAQPVVQGGGEFETLLWAFREENQTSGDSTTVYRGGWDVLL